MNLPKPYYDGAGITIHHGDALDVLRQLPGGLVQTCVTSPPYWGLRTYGVEGQLGLEATPEEYIARLVELFAEVRRVLRDDGTLWLNLGDSYAGGGRGGNPKHSAHDKQATNQGSVTTEMDVPEGLKPKSLCGIPWRVALALQAGGWYLRSDIIWHKPNPMPESCTDRPTKAHEYMFLMSKRAHYYYDADAVREEAEYGYGSSFRSANYECGRSFGNAPVVSGGAHKPGDGGTRNKRTVWTVATESFKGAHFATYPRKLIEPCILAGANDRACAECGKAWRRVVESQRVPTRPGENTKVKVPGGWDVAPGAHGTLHRTDRTEATYRDTAEVGNRDPQRHVSVRTRKGHEPDCKCGTKETKPSIVLDPFMGSGTTAEVARKHGCHCIGIELNPEYIALAAKRLAQGVLEFE